ncbi:MAG: hypothetical protein P9F75_21140 [Candidatus Contendobacter sp.]|nr:hypothetical protein [Candidatus Contendobacter sp.]
MKPSDSTIPPSGDDWARLAGLLPHLRIVHHVRGRLRVRLHAGVLGWLAQGPNAAPESWLARLPGITALHLNKSAASLVIEYDARRIPPQWWERLLHSRGEALPVLLAEVGLFTDPDHCSSHPPEGAPA